MTNASATAEHGGALYYPHVHVRDATWLKQALLYWDFVRRIVPDGPVEDADDIAPAVSENLLRDTPPYGYVAGAAERFKTKIVAAVAHDRPSERNHIWHALREFLGNQNSMMYLHPDKIDPALREWLLFTRLAEKEDIEFVAKWEVGAAYMLCLATEISSKIGAPVVTDNPLLDECAQYVQFGLYPGQSSSDWVQQTPAVLGAGRSLRVSVRLPLPSRAELAHTDWKEILKFQQRTDTSRRAFRKFADDIAKRLARVDDANALRDLMSDQNKQIAEAIEARTRALDNFRTVALGTALTMSIPTGILGKLAVAALGAFAAPPIAATGLAVAGLTWWGKTRGDAARVAAMPGHYVFEMNKFFR